MSAEVGLTLSRASARACSALATAPASPDLRASFSAFSASRTAESCLTDRSRTSWTRFSAISTCRAAVSRALAPFSADAATALSARSASAASLSKSGPFSFAYACVTALPIDRPALAAILSPPLKPAPICLAICEVSTASDTYAVASSTPLANGHPYSVTHQQGASSSTHQSRQAGAA